MPQGKAISLIQKRHEVAPRVFAAAQKASGRTLAEAFGNDWFELPNLGHDVKQFIARVNLVCAALPELEFPPFDTPALVAALTRAFAGHTPLKEAQTVELRPHFRRHLAPEQLEWLDELLRSPSLGRMVER